MQSATLDDEAPSTDDLDDAAYQRDLALLRRVGTALIADLDAAADPATLVARANAFPNVALAVRRTILLSRHIRDNPSAAISADAERTDSRREIIRTVEDTIERKADPAEAPDLRVELLERLDSPEFELDLRRRPRQDLIQELCRDLGLKISIGTYPRRTPDDIAILCAKAAAPAASGLPRWSATRPHPARPPPGRPAAHRAKN